MPTLPSRIRLRFTYANVVSTVALVAALGTGTAYAANTIGSVDIIDGAVAHVDLAGDAVAGDRVVDHSLTLVDLSGADVQTTVGLPRLKPGRCVTSTIGVTGARPGQFAALSPLTALRKGVVLSAEAVRADDQMEVGVCNLGNRTAKASAVRVRVVSFS
jgi:hypothetical protein